MTVLEQAKAYQDFFYKSEPGIAYLEQLQALETSHIGKAQRTGDVNELCRSAGNREALEHIEAVIGQVANQ